MTLKNAWLISLQPSRARDDWERVEAHLVAATWNLWFCVAVWVVVLVAKLWRWTW